MTAIFLIIESICHGFPVIYSTYNKFLLVLHKSFKYPFSVGHLEPVSMSGNTISYNTIDYACYTRKIPKTKAKRKNETYLLLSTYISPSCEMNL